MDGQDLATYFARMAQQLSGVRSVEDTLKLLVTTAVELIDGCDHASISYLDQKVLRSASSNDDIGPTLDALQTETQEGPCMDTIRDGGLLVTGDLRSDERWPEYGPRAAAATGVVSSMGVELLHGGRRVGALNLFAERPDAFAPDGQRDAIIALLASHAGPALAAALAREDFERALASRDLIGQAKGILMARSGVDADAAYEMLSSASQRMNVKLVEVAQRLVDGTLTDPPQD